MRHLALALILLTFWSLGITAQADSLPENIHTFNTDSEELRATNAFVGCTMLFKQWPGPGYEETLYKMAGLYQNFPDGAAYYLFTCQSLYKLNYIDPLKPTVSTPPTSSPKMANLLAVLDVLDFDFQFLRESIRVYILSHKSELTTIPPAPFAMLSGFASSEQDVDEALRVRVRKLVANLTAVGVTVATDAVLYRLFMGLARSAGSLGRSGGEFITLGLLASKLGEGAGYAVNENMRQNHIRQLWPPMRRLTEQLATGNVKIAGTMSEADDIQRCSARPFRAPAPQNCISDPKLVPSSAVPFPVKVLNFYRYAERLGESYRYQLSAGSDVHLTIYPDHACDDQIRAYFQDPKANGAAFLNGFATQKPCASGVAVWIGASLYLSANYPENPLVQNWADKLMTRAMDGYELDQAIKEYELHRPKCTSDFLGQVTCVDEHGFPVDENGNPVRDTATKDATSTEICYWNRQNRSLETL